MNKRSRCSFYRFLKELVSHPTIFSTYVLHWKMITNPVLLPPAISIFSFRFVVIPCTQSLDWTTSGIFFWDIVCPHFGNVEQKVKISRQKSNKIKKGFEIFVFYPHTSSYSILTKTPPISHLLFNVFWMSD